MSKIIPETRITEISLGWIPQVRESYGWLGVSPNFGMWFDISNQVAYCTHKTKAEAKATLQTYIALKYD